MCAGWIVNGHDVKGQLLLPRGPKRQPTNPPEPVDRDSRHRLSLHHSRDAISRGSLSSLPRLQQIIDEKQLHQGQGIAVPRRSALSEGTQLLWRKILERFHGGEEVGPDSLLQRSCCLRVDGPI